MTGESKAAERGAATPDEAWAPARLGSWALVSVVILALVSVFALGGAATDSAPSRCRAAAGSGRSFVNGRPQHHALAGRAVALAAASRPARRTVDGLAG